MARAAELLAGRYHLVITNVPYLARRKQSQNLRDFCQRNFDAAKNDLATVFLERCLGLCEEGGTASLVLPQNWLFLASYRRLREKMLKEKSWFLLARLGPRAFETISGEVVKAILLILSHGNPTYQSTQAPNGTMYGVDVSEVPTVGGKFADLRDAKVTGVTQAQQLANPDGRIVLEDDSGHALLSELADALVGLQTCDDTRFVTAFWEHLSINKSIWEFMQSTPATSGMIGGLSWLVRWERVSWRDILLANCYADSWSKGGR